MNAATFYREAKREVLSLGYANEITWQQSQSPELVGEQDFLKEAAWVVYCSGFRESVVRRYFDFISLCFCDWLSADEIAEKRHQCVMAAMQVMRNRRKHEAVAEIATRVAVSGFENFKKCLIAEPIETLRGLPFMGAVTSLHLAKNLGFDVAKPDRHLLRLQAYLGYSDVGTMCNAIAKASGDPIRVVDVVLWRYLERRSTIFHDHR
ncbi:hypothetical protein [Burkholderia gladioli]|uniref:hypothetical protein n=1 Tax=Burkholderia gladioli TaxID=28095 RepID=UPI000F80AE9E|nr:hypothetical protein [Burkholderia gladioli]